MACLRDRRGERGYATASAIAISMALAMVASAVTGLSAAELESARGGLARLASEAELEGAQNAAVTAVLSSGQSTRLRWSLPTGLGAVDVLAEPEALKTSYADAAKATDAQLARMGVGDPGPLRGRLAADVDPTDITPTRDLDASTIWRICAPSRISRFGETKLGALGPAQTPDGRRFSWRAGDVWRIRVASSDGWSDDRLVRFSGDAIHPAAIVERRLSRQGTADRQCDTIFAKG